MNLKDKSYKYIKDKIVNCEYRPGQVLVETELMESLGASRTPIREALNKLEQENLVHIMPKRGVFVCELTMSDVNQVYEVRELIEPYIICAYGHTIPLDVLQRQYAKIESQGGDASTQERYKDDDDLHKMLLTASGNRYLSSIMDTIYSQNHRLRVMSGQTVESRLADTQKEHLEICEKLFEKDYEGAANAMLRHLQCSKNAAVETMLSGSNLTLQSTRFI